MGCGESLRKGEVNPPTSRNKKQTQPISITTVRTKQLKLL